MTTNKLPPLSELIETAKGALSRIHEGLYPREWEAEVMKILGALPDLLSHAEALRQSQSLPAGAVAEEKFTESCGCVFCDLKCNHSAEECSLQADAREKGEAVDVLIEEIQAFAEAYPEDVFGPVTDEEREQHGSLISRASASMGRHMGRRFLPKALALRAATQPAQASEKDNG